MVILSASNLNKRHEEFNRQVQLAAINKTTLEETSEMSDIDKLFQIDLASKYKNINYILEVFTSGDSLHISRALRCDWISNDEFSQYMNPQYLDTNIFPSMAKKMKKKLLATLSARIRNGDRAEEFHQYCMRNRMYKLGMGFLLYTNESFKKEILTLHPHVYNDFNRNPEYVEHYIGNSFLLADYYLKVVPDSARSMVLYKLRYLYSVSQEQYLDLLETYQSLEHVFHVTSLKLSRSIMKKHKKRVLKNPWLYLNTLHAEAVTKFSNSDDAKVYAIPLLRDEHYWDKDYYGRNSYFLKLIPLGERFSFIKKIVTERYPDEPFENHINFFNYKCYEMMSSQEKENWALRHVATGEELHGCGNDYIWYQFVNFDLAFVELKKYILITPDNEKRTKILKTLIDIAKTQKELTILLEYYYDRHINELGEYKRSFLDKLIYSKHKVLNFNDECWAAIEKIFYSIEVYHKSCEPCNNYFNHEYRVLSLIYYITHENQIPEVFYDFVIDPSITSSDMRCIFGEDLTAKDLDMICEYLLQCYTKHMLSLIIENANNKEKILNILGLILDLTLDFDKTLEDIPKIVHEHIMLNFEEIKHHRYYTRLNEPPSEFQISDIMHFLKKDASLVVTNFPKIKEWIQKTHWKKKNNINWLIRKLQIYFHRDIGPEYIQLLSECLSEDKLHLQTARVATFGILNLSIEKDRLDFLKKYVPVDTKVDHVKISRDFLTIQKAICSVACHSRPPLLLCNLRDYIKGDYLQYCMPIFDSYLANLTPTQCLSFVESILDSPVSIQKHGLRLAFQCFSPGDLKNLVLNVWKKTKNISLRKVIYKALFKKVNYYHDNLPAQWELFGALTIFTNDLHQDDDEGVFELLDTQLPPHIIGQHLQSAYIVVNSFPKRTINHERLTRIVRAIENNLEPISKSVLLAIMEDHINTMLDQNLILNHDHTLLSNNELIDAKWSLIKSVIVKHKDMHIVYLLSGKCLKNWYKTNDGEYVYRRFWTLFVNDLETLSYREQTSNYIDINSIFRTILAEMDAALPQKEIFILLWRLHVGILTRQVLAENDSDIGTDIETKKMLAKETILKLSRRIGDVLKQHVDERTFYQSFEQDIQDVIDDNITHGLVANINRSVDTEIRSVDVIVLLCSVLMEYGAREIYIFVMNFLPQDYHGEYSSEYLDVINKLKNLDDKEIQYIMCLNFYSSDFVYREFMP